MSKHEKSSRKSSPQSSASEAGDSPTPSSAGALASKIVQVPITDVKKGSKLLYPGNKVIEVESVEFYVPAQNGISFALGGLYVVRFVGQPADCYLAFEPTSSVYLFKG